MVPKGIVVHSTGANNPNLKRYIAPDDGAIGKNDYNNDWNREGLDVCVHGFIGKDKNGKVKFYQTLPFDMCCWGCGGGSNGSFNYNPAYIQFEMCEDSLNDKAYCKACYDKAVEVCAYLCKEYNISTSNIVSHKEAAAKGYASSHVDPHNWWDKFGYTMSGFRVAVKAKLTNRAVKTKSKCPLYVEPYKDPVDHSIKSVTVAKDTELTYVNDDGYGWSEVKYKGKTYYILNLNLNISGLSSFPVYTLARKTKAYLIKGGKLSTKATTLKKDTKVKEICTILSGPYKGKTYIGVGSKRYYV
ncbi:MAG: N-acetylmuramoyl-L-alanine amidase [Ruminococcus sp.]|nr:N-acetylmuramoyl-L-alanine amidase [Ruminococcus sp.]